MICPLANWPRRNLPYLQRHLRWTWKALQFDWGQLRNITSMAFGRVQNTRSLNEVVLQYMGNTLLLAGTANLLIFLLGIPFALFLALAADRFQQRYRGKARV